jgi:glycosyltransferase involved in cell wall biosynthesis
MSVDLLCLHSTVAAGAAQATSLTSEGDVDVFGPGGRWLSIIHAARKAPSLLISLLATRSATEARMRSAGITLADLEARSVANRWQKRRRRAIGPTILFGANPLSFELLMRRDLPGPFMFVETGDFTFRSPAFTRLLQERRAIHVPLNEEDAPDGLQVVGPVVFPVDEPFRTLPLRTETATRQAQVGFAGRLHESKGLLDLIEATRRARAAGTRLTLQIVGDGPEGPRLRVLAEGLDWMKVRDGISDAAALRSCYEEFSVFVVSSPANEGLPVSMLEALLSGARVVATDVGAIRERIGDLVTIVPPRDPSHLAEGIVTALRSDVDRAKALGRIPTPREYARELLKSLTKYKPGQAA